MKQNLYFHALSPTFYKDFTNQESTTNFTDAEESHNTENIEIRIPLTPQFTSSQPQDDKLILRTSSLSFLKLNSDSVAFELFGKRFTLDSSSKSETKQSLQKWIKRNKILGLRKIQIKMVVYAQLSKRNPQFQQDLQSAIQEYSIFKIRKIQEQQKKILSQQQIQSQEFT